MKQLSDKVIFITGGASGIGKACVDAYVCEGALVFIMDKNEAALHAVLDEIKLPHQGFAGDVSKQADVETALNKAVGIFGRLDAIHNNAGITHPSTTIDETTEDEWDALMNTNLKSIFWTTKFGLVSLKASNGCILNTSSLTAEIGQNLHAAYTASKGAVNTLTKSMALDYGLIGVRVNAIAPAGVWTPMLYEWASRQPDPGHIEEYLDYIHALGYCPDADVVADVAVFLLSDAARFITGCILPVSGGAELGYKKY